MPQGPAPAGSGRDEDPAREPREPARTPDPMTEEDWQAWCDWQADQDEPPDPDEEEPDPDGLPGPWEYDLDAIIADCRRVTAEEAALCARAARLGLSGGQPVGLGRRGPGQPGSARRAAGEYLSRAAGFAAGMLLDTMPGCNALAGFAAEAAGDDDRYDGARDDEVAGAIAAWDRIEAHASARKHAAVAEFIRRRPEPGCSPEGPAAMPAGWDEFTVTELASVLAESRGAAEGLLDLAHVLEVKLPGTRAAFRDGTLRESKVEIIARATTVLDPAEARAAEALVLGRAGRLTPGGLRAAIARAVMEVAPEQGPQAAGAGRPGRPGAAVGRGLRERRADGPRTAPGRGAGRRPADHRVGPGAEEGRPGRRMDELRARAYLDILLDKDSRPDQNAGTDPGSAAGPAARTARTARAAQAGTAPAAREAAGRRPRARATRPRDRPRRALPAGFAGRINLTVPLATLLDLADRPGEIPGIGPIDPWLARDLAGAAARKPQDDVVRDRDRRARARDRPRLRPARTREPGQTPGQTRQTRPAGRT